MFKKLDRLIAVHFPSWDRWGRPIAGGVMWGMVYIICLSLVMATVNNFVRDRPLNPFPTVAGFVSELFTTSDDEAAEQRIAEQFINGEWTEARRDNYRVVYAHPDYPDVLIVVSNLVETVFIYDVKTDVTLSFSNKRARRDIENAAFRTDGLTDDQLARRNVTTSLAKGRND